MQIAHALNQFLQGKIMVQPEEEDALQYIDFSEWQRELFLEKADAGFAYWTTKNISTNSFQSIFKKANEANLSSPQYARFHKVLSPQIMEKLPPLLQDRGSSVQHFLMTIWWKLLFRYVNAPCSLCYRHHGRSHEAVQSIVGLFEKYLALPDALLKEEDSVWQLAAKIQEVVTQDEAHQDCFDRNIGQRNTSITFPYQFAYYPTPAFNSNLELLDFSAHAEDYELKANFILRPNQELHICLDYDGNYFEERWMSTLVEQFEAMILGEIMKEEKGLEAWAHEKIKWNCKEQHQLNPISSNVLPTQNVVDLFEDAVKQNTLQTAIVYKEKTVSYQALNESVNRLARLIQQKIKGETKRVIGVQMTNPLNAVTTMLAILKSGNAFLPIDHTNPGLRTNLMLRQCNAILLLTDQSSEEPTGWENNLSWDEVELQWQSMAANNLNLSIAIDDPCYLIFTSGSTGQPKGVQIAHHSLVNYLNWLVPNFTINANDATVLFSSMSFDLGYTALWSSLVSGATLHLVNPTQFLPFLAKANTYFSKHHITYIKCTPSHFKLMLEADDFELVKGKQDIRLIVLGGEPIVPSDLATYFQHQANVEMVNHYGPTETTIGVICHPIKKGELQKYAQLPVIGRPFGNHQVWICDENQEPVAIGEYGELYISGPGVALGYAGREELTQEKFVSLNFTENKNITCYATGDLGRWLPDGTIQLAGRKDNQIKVRGYRIEPEEISSVIGEMAGVKTAYTLIDQASHQEAVLKSFVVLEGPQVEMASITEFLGERLPAYMIPAQLFKIDALPLSGNGKVNQGALREMAHAKPNIQDTVLPSSELELALVEIWASLFNQEHLGLTDHFFQLGGHSLMAMKMQQSESSRQTFSGLRTTF
ncbi:MAG: amino acid adenylation domain-containing protein, partial [Bacteroidota bacterium]